MTFDVVTRLEQDKTLTMLQIPNQSVGEDRGTRLLVTLEKSLRTGTEFFFEFLCPKCKRYVSEELVLHAEEDENYVFRCDVPSCVMQDEGLVQIQLVARSADTHEVKFKSVLSYRSSFFVHQSINATQTYSVPDYFAMAQGLHKDMQRFLANSEDLVQNQLEALLGHDMQAISVCTEISNQNLLINGDFRVNQRGGQIYQQPNGSSKIFTVDRWAICGSGTSFNSVTKTFGGAGTLVYCFEPKDVPTGEVLTFSVKAAGASRYGKVFFRAVKMNNTVENCLNVTWADAGNLLKGSFAVPTENANNPVKYYEMGYWQPESRNVRFEWFKLEVGKAATPHQPRPYIQELTLCQRYYQRLNVVGEVAEKRSGVTTFFLPIQVPMQTVQTLAVVQPVEICGFNGTDVSYQYDMTVVRQFDNGVIVRFDGNTGSSTMSLCRSGEVTLDADYPDAPTAV